MLRLNMHLCISSIHLLNFIHCNLCMQSSLNSSLPMGAPKLYLDPIRCRGRWWCFCLKSRSFTEYILMHLPVTFQFSGCICSATAWICTAIFYCRIMSFLVQMPALLRRTIGFVPKQDECARIYTCTCHSLAKKTETKVFGLRVHKCPLFRKSSLPTWLTNQVWSLEIMRGTSCSPCQED